MRSRPREQHPDREEALEGISDLSRFAGVVHPIEELVQPSEEVLDGLEDNLEEVELLEILIVKMCVLDLGLARGGGRGGGLAGRADGGGGARIELFRKCLHERQGAG